MTPHAILATLRHCASQHSRVDLTKQMIWCRISCCWRSPEGAITDPGFVAWAKGAIRIHARFVARTAGRRRVRDAGWETPYAAPNPYPRFSHAFLSSLPPAQRIVARLANLGLDRAEIAHLLGLKDATLRQCLRGLRKAFDAHGGEAELCDEVPPVPPDGVARRSLKQSLHVHAARAFAIDLFPSLYPLRGGVRSFCDARNGR